MRRLVWLLAGVSAAALVGCGGPDREKYVRENLRLIDAFPVLAGARVLTTGSFPYENNDTPAARTIGYATARTYRLPPGVSPRKAISFYRRALAGTWRVVDLSAAPSASLRRGDAYVHVLAGGGRVIVEVDHDCYKGRRVGQMLRPLTRAP